MEWTATELAYLIVKRAQAEIFISVADTLGVKGVGRGRPIPEEIYQFRLDSAAKVIALNAKGAKNASK